MDPPCIVVVVLCYTIRGKLPLDQFVTLSFWRGVIRGRVWILGSIGLCTSTVSLSRALWRRHGRVICPFAIIKYGFRPNAIIKMGFAATPFSIIVQQTKCHFIPSAHYERLLSWVKSRRYLLTVSLPISTSHQRRPVLAPPPPSPCPRPRRRLGHPGLAVAGAQASSPPPPRPRHQHCLGFQVRDAAQGLQSAPPPKPIEVAPSPKAIQVSSFWWIGYHDIDATLDSTLIDVLL